MTNQINDAHRKDINRLIMEQPKLINNINELVADDLKTRLSNHSRISIAAASFSIYAFESLKKELEGM